MKSVFSILMLLVSLNAYTQLPAFVTIKCELHHPLPEKQALSIRGNHPLLGNWKHGKVYLAKRSDSLWAGIFMLKRDSEIAFILDGGSPNKTYEDIDTIHLRVQGDTTINIIIDAPMVISQPDRPKGRMHFMPKTASDEIRDRLVTVRTPIGYERDTSRRYPVVYLQDGQSLFSPEGSPDKFEWRLDETLDSLEYHELIDPFILVAIDHVFDARSLEFSDNELGTAYRAYLKKDLPRAIDHQFRTIKDAGARYIGGAVAGGYVSCLTAWEAPDVYGHVIALSPALEIYENNYFALTDDYDGPPKQIQYYIDQGEFGMDEKIAPGVERMARYLSENGYEYHHHFEPNSIPDGENMARRIIPAILYFFTRNKE